MWKNLKALRETQKMKQDEFGASIGIKKTTYQGYESGVNDPPAAFWIAVSDRYRVSTDYLLGQTNDPHGTKYPAEVSPLEAKYNALDAHSRRVVDAVIDVEAGRFRRVVVEPAQLVKKIPLFPTSAAAGAGEPDTGLPFEDYTVPEDSKAEFAVRITGDSMEPELHNGDIALCVKRPPEVGEIVVVMVNGFLLVKQFITDGKNLYLRSINRKRRDCDLDVWASGNDTVRLYGTVIHKKIPLVDEWG